jgi:hypothetical protein
VTTGLHRWNTFTALGNYSNKGKTRGVFKHPEPAYTVGLEGFDTIQLLGTTDQSSSISSSDRLRSSSSLTSEFALTSPSASSPTLARLSRPSPPS